ncbi:hypothetical protein [Neopusillimonas maritima]|nr:hypothetical protein [Neopusillimonas maritima]
MSTPLVVPGSEIQGRGLFERGAFDPPGRSREFRARSEPGATSG